MHDAGYLHRDIKPGNFLLGTKETDTQRHVIVIDFGLSRRHLKVDGTVKPKRAQARWVGSRRYMSLNTHLRKEQGRRDDLYSLLYVLIECITGTLPWAHLRGLQNLDRVRDMKVQYNNEKLVRGLPEEFNLWLEHVKVRPASLMAYITPFQGPQVRVETRLRFPASAPSQTLYASRGHNSNTLRLGDGGGSWSAPVCFLIVTPFQMARPVSQKPLRPMPPLIPHQWRLERIGPTRDRSHPKRQCLLEPLLPAMLSTTSLRPQSDEGAALFFEPSDMVLVAVWP